MFSEIIKDETLRPYFFDLISKNFVLGLSDLHRINYSDRMRFQKEYYESLLKLSSALSGKVHEKDISVAIREVTLYYISTVGKFGVSFEDYNPSDN
jgi:hypothetical protein